MKAIIALVLVSFSVFYTSAQEAVSWPSWTWKPTDQVEVQKILDGKESIVFKVTPAMKREIGKFRKQGFRHLYFVSLGKTRSGYEGWLPFLTKKAVIKPSVDRVRSVPFRYIEAQWDGKTWMLYVNNGDDDCP